MIAIVDYGVGNLFSLVSSFRAIGADITVAKSAEELNCADKIVLPGVGAFEDAARLLRESGLDDALRREAAAGKPLMGVCLGMQLLLDKSFEYGKHEGLGLIPGEVRPIEGYIQSDLKIPHIGWNGLAFPAEKHPLFAEVKEGDCVYFVHSYAAFACDHVIATASYGKDLCAAVAKDNVMGCQFHPEKSGGVGLKILKAFCEWGERNEIISCH